MSDIMKDLKEISKTKKNNTLFKVGVAMKYMSILLLCFGLVSSLEASDWSCFKGSPERRGSSDVPAPDTPYLLWRVDLGSELYASPVVKNGKVCQGAFEEIMCIDLDTGEVLWTSSIPAHNSTPVLTDDNLIVATNRGVTAVSLENGDLIWEYLVSQRFSSLDLIDYIVSSPTVSDGKVVSGTMPYAFRIQSAGSHKSNENYVICLDEKTGKEEWVVETTLGVLTSPCIVDGKVFAASREMLCIDLEKGRVIWDSEYNHPWDVKIPIKERYAFDRSTPALYHGMLIGGSTDMNRAGTESRYTGWQKVVAVDQYTGNICWEWVKEGILFSSPSIYKGKIYFYSFDGIIRCISLLNGEKLWETQISESQELDFGGSRQWPSPAVTDGKVYIGTIEGIFYCLDALTGEILWKYEMGTPTYTAPALVPGKVLISSTNGRLYCFGIDPAAYKLKAEQYLEDRVYDTAEEFLIKAKDYAEDDEEIEEINNLLTIVNAEMPEYEKRLHKLSEAESLMDEADEIIWKKKFKEAKNLYKRAFEIYEQYNDEFKLSFCEKRIEYIEKRIEQQSWIETHWWLFILLICVILAFSFKLKRYFTKSNSWERKLS